ncbi:response regulator [Trichothermofontia sichuanensis B231]|uniref:response regulator n=1 Tax=Trichothermofontia sichuanensis TaxID=3045816 RepID=UPI002245597E|nr:response regulator [Trichothermofontia sichuanensis]UZQ55565.1 response regulator [Trichothermofontia sichuanensis B231]
MKKVLVIEPEKSLQRNILTLVETEGFYGLGAEDGHQGLQLAFAQMPDLILCDTQVPNLDGFTILQSLKYDPETAQIPFLLITEMGDRVARQRALALGASDTLPKPLKMANLRNTIAQCLGKPDLSPTAVVLPEPAISLFPACDLLQPFFDGAAMASIGLALLDQDLRFVALNDPFARLNGYPTAAYLGRTFREVLPTIAPGIEPILRQVFQTGQPLLKLKLRGTLPGQPTQLHHWLVSYVPIATHPAQATAPTANQLPAYVAVIVVEIDPSDWDGWEALP